MAEMAISRLSTTTQVTIRTSSLSFPAELALLNSVLKQLTVIYVRLIKECIPLRTVFANYNVLQTHSDANIYVIHKQAHIT